MSASSKAKKKPSKAKLRLLYLALILWEETDDKEGLSIEKLGRRIKEKLGNDVDRKTIYDDLAALQAVGKECGIVLNKHKRASWQYSFDNRLFSMPELVLMADAVQSSRFLSEEESKEIVEKIERLARKAKKGETSDFDKSVVVENRAKKDSSKKVLARVSAIQKAISANRKIEFEYGDYTVQGVAGKLGKIVRVKRKDDTGKPKVYKVSPIEVVFSEGSYYLQACSKDHERVTHYRIDRMEGLKISADPIEASDEFRKMRNEAKDIANRSFSMFGGERKGVPAKFEIRGAKERALNSFVDRFGEGLQVSVNEDGTWTVSASVIPSPPLYSWLFQFGDSVKIVQGEDLLDGFKEHLRKEIELYHLDDVPTEPSGDE